MDPLRIAATKNTPEVTFDFAANRFALCGKSYPEDARSFYDPLLEKLHRHFEPSNSGDVVFDIDLTVFDSSTTRVLADLFEVLDVAGARGMTVALHWACGKGDEDLKEKGVTLAEEMTFANFTLRRKEDSAPQDGA
ncbi:DUF1987 domain-containing protein [Magnetospira sp. QH-2]|uniref:DUF1987 domain-containing protein n=1 Tax=Magnetospira sp. (strain QH-2) TaxID=1288970 RepID=UPI0005F9ED3A|nr:DUF1987 domain-containing protein [Magnetospira sp. QH-2]